jgi:hypothetical protein
LMMQQCVTFTSSNGQTLLATQVWFFFIWEENNNDQVKALYSTYLGLRQTHL